MSRSGTYDPELGFIPDDDVPQEPPKQTNADRIREMSDEELAEFLYRTKQNYCDGHCSNVWDVDCPACALKWLKKEVADEHT